MTKTSFSAVFALSCLISMAACGDSSTNSANNANFNNVTKVRLEEITLIQDSFFKERTAFPPDISRLYEKELPLQEKLFNTELSGLSSKRDTLKSDLGKKDLERVARALHLSVGALVDDSQEKNIDPPTAEDGIRSSDEIVDLLLQRYPGVKQQAIADQVGVPANRLSAWKSGRHYPGIEDLLKISQALGLSLDALVRRPSGLGNNPTSAVNVVVDPVRHYESINLDAAQAEALDVTATLISLLTDIQSHAVHDSRYAHGLSRALRDALAPLRSVRSAS